MRKGGVMEPIRKKIVDGKKVEEFYWNGELVVYVDNELTDKAFDDIKSIVKKEKLNKKEEELIETLKGLVDKYKDNTKEGKKIILNGISFIVKKLEKVL